MGRDRLIEIGVVALGCGLVTVVVLYLIDRLFEWYFKDKNNDH